MGLSTACQRGRHTGVGAPWSEADCVLHRTASLWITDVSSATLVHRVTVGRHLLLCQGVRFCATRLSMRIEVCVPRISPHRNAAHEIWDTEGG